MLLRDQMQQLLLTIPLEKELNSTIITLQYLMKVLFYMAEKNKQTWTPRNTKNEDVNVPNAPSGSYGNFVLYVFCK